MHYRFTIWIILIAVNFSCQPSEKKLEEAPASTVTAEIDSVTGLAIDPNFELVRGQCTACHSAQLITQNSASREGWLQMIRWMQKDQGLWDLGENEGLILDYLSEHYGTKRKGRRAPLTDIEWYVLPDEP